MAQNSTPLILRLLASSVTAARRAGGIVRDVMKSGDLGIKEKNPNDYQTEADISAQRCIIASISNKYPSVMIIGEEGNIDCDVPDDWIANDLDKEIISKQCPNALKETEVEDVVVWVDPLDGTSEFTQGLVEHVTVLIGLAVKGKPIAGVIHQPFYKTNDNTFGRTIWGMVGLGVGGFIPQKPPTNKLILTTTRSHLNETVLKTLDALEPDEILKVGGAGHKVLLLLEGRAHAYVFASRGCKKWDTCAPEAVLIASGGILTNLNGEPYSYDRLVEHENKSGVFATCNTVNHDQLLNKIPLELRDLFRNK